MSAGLHHNLIVVSDLHLGEDLRPGGANVSHLRYLVKLERELAAFLSHHAKERVGGRPWRLVINGDMVDFMSIMIMPDGPARADDADVEDHRFGLGFGEAASRQKLECVMTRHATVFRQLAAFVAGGNQLCIVLGNHDAEFHYPSVQKTFVDGLAALLEVDEPAFAERIEFCPWFYYQENFVYIEHGHQYDEYCSVDYLLQPVAQYGKKSGIALSIAHGGMRYFANQLSDIYNPHTAEHWGFFDYVKWGWAQGLRGATKLFYFYGLMIWRLVEIWYRTMDRQRDGERRSLHRARLKQLARQWRITEEKLEALDALRRPPVIKRFWKVMAALFIDRFLLALVAMTAAIVLAVNLRGWWALVGPVLTMVGAAGINQLLGRWRTLSSGTQLRAAPRLIEKLVCAPIIVFGHSHAPEVHQLDGGAVYFNTGTWASEDSRHAFTHLVVLAETETEAPHAELRQWRDGASAPYVAIRRS